MIASALEGALREQPEDQMVGGLPDGAQRLIDDRDHRSKTGKKMSAALRHDYTSVVKNAVGEVMEMKDAAAAIKKLALRQSLGADDKRALGAAAKSIGSVIAGSIAVGGVDADTAAGLANHFATEALVRQNLFEDGRWPIYEGPSDAVRETVERVVDKTVRELDGLGSMPDKKLSAILAKVHRGQPSAEPEGEAGKTASGERDWKPGTHNRRVPDELPGRPE